MDYLYALQCIRGAIGIVVFAVLYFGGGILTKEFIPAHVDHLVKYFVLFFCLSIHLRLQK